MVRVLGEDAVHGFDALGVVGSVVEFLSKEKRDSHFERLNSSFRGS